MLTTRVVAINSCLSVMSVTDFGWLYRPDIVPVGLKRPSARIENLKSKFATIYIWMLGGSEVGVDLSLQQRNPKGSMIFLQGAPTDILYWVSSGLVDIVCPEPDGGQIQASLLGPGDIFGFVEISDSRGNPVQALQSRARTQCPVRSDNAGSCQQSAQSARPKTARASLG